MEFLVFGTTFSNISAISWRPVWWWRKLDKASDPGQATGKLYYLRLRVECTHFLGANPRRIGDRLVWLIAPAVFQHLIIRAEFWHPFSFLSQNVNLSFIILCFLDTCGLIFIWNTFMCLIQVHILVHESGQMLSRFQFFPAEFSVPIT